MPSYLGSVANAFVDAGLGCQHAGSGHPLYLRLAEALNAVLAREGVERLPSARALAAAAGLNRATVGAAYRELARRGLMVVRRGRPGRQTCEPRRNAPEAFGDPPENTLDLARYVPDQALLPGGSVLGWLGLGEGEGEAVAQYGDPWGYGPLREWLAVRLRGWGITDGPVLVTSGVQHGLDLLLRALLRAGDAVLVEDPTYPGLPPLLAVHQLTAVGMPIHPDGLHLSDLAALIHRVRPRLAIITPTLQNPSGLVLAAAERRGLLEELQGNGVQVVEELFDPGLVDSGQAPLPLAAMDHRVIAVGSFSKVLFPGLRVGWLTGPREVVERVAAVKRATDLSGSPFLEATAWTLCRRGNLDAQVIRLRAAAAERRSTVLGELKRSATSIRWSEPRGGFSLLVYLPAGRSARAVTARAAQQGVWVLPGPAMSVSGRDDVVRIAYAAVGGELLHHGVQRFVAALAPATRELPLV